MKFVDTSRIEPDFYHNILKYVLELIFSWLPSFVVENIGVEPMTSCVQGKRSSQLS